MTTAAPHRGVTDYTLTHAEMHRVAMVGVMRNLGALEAGRTHRHRYQGDGWSNHILGAAGEFCVARWAGILWRPALDADEGHPDVGAYHVRTTAHAGGRLIVYRDDQDAALFVLVTGQLPRFRLAGWAYGDEAKDPRWWDNTVRSPTFMVPQAHLRPMGTCP